MFNNNMIEKISSLHDDVLIPKTSHDAGLGEYRNYPDRFNPEDKSVLERLAQFGVDLQSIEETFDKKIGELSFDEYVSVISEALRARYDVIVVSVYDQYMFPSPDKPSDDERFRQMFSLVEHYEKMGAKLGLNLVKRVDDFKEDKNIVLGLEAGAHLINSIDDARKLSDKGIKLFGLQYGADTPLATSTGLTKLGNEVVRDFFGRNIIVDLAHSGFKTRQDVIALADDLEKGNLVSYTHGCTEDDVAEIWKDKIGERVIKTYELKQIISIGGIIGLGVTKPFFPSTEKLAERIDAVSQLDCGIERIAIGTDFGGIPPEFMNDIKSPDDFKRLADILASHFKFSEKDINKVLRTNVKEWIKKAIK